MTRKPTNEVFRQLACFAFFLFFLRATAADHNSAVRNHFRNPCPHLGEEMKNVLMTVNAIQCCACPPDHYYVSPCQEKKYNTTQCSPCPTGGKLPFSLEPQGPEKCVLPSTKPPATTSETKTKTPANQQDDIGKDTGQSFPAWGIALIIVALVLVMGSVMWCKRKTIRDFCTPVKKPIDKDSLTDVEASPDTSNLSVLTANTNTKPQPTNRTDAIEPQASPTQVPQWNKKSDYKQVPQSDPDGAMTERTVTHDCGGAPGKVLADPLTAPYSEPRTVREVATPPRLPQPIADTNDVTPTRSEPNTSLPPDAPVANTYNTTYAPSEPRQSCAQRHGYNVNRAHNIKKIKEAFLSIQTRHNVSIEPVQVKFFATAFDLTPDQISAAQSRMSGSNCAFLAEVFEKIVSCKSSTLDLNKVVDFFKEKKIMSVYDCLIENLNTR